MRLPAGSGPEGHSLLARQHCPCNLAGVAGRRVSMQPRGLITFERLHLLTLHLATQPQHLQGAAFTHSNVEPPAN